MDYIGIATLIISVGTIFLFVRQNRIASDATKSQNVLVVVEYLMSAEIRTARHHVLTKLKNKKYKDWSKSDIGMADQVCASYALAASLMNKHYVAKDIFLDDWGPSITNNYNILKKHLRTRQKEAGNRYWDDFDWLNQEVVSWEEKNYPKGKKRQQISD